MKWYQLCVYVKQNDITLYINKQHRSISSAPFQRTSWPSDGARTLPSTRRVPQWGGASPQINPTGAACSLWNQELAERQHSAQANLAF